MKIAELYTELTVKDDKFKRSMIDVKGLTKSAAKGLEALARTAKFAFVGAAAGLGFMVKAASDAEETANKFNVVFKGIEDSATSMTNTLAESYGMSRREAQQFLADTGDMLTGFGLGTEEALNMSNAVAELGADLASFTNIEGGTEVAVQALTRGLLGEREMMKSLGIAILEEDVKLRIAAKGQEKLKGSAMRAARAQATLELAMEQSKNAIGDFNRSQGSLANQWRIMMAALDDLSVKIGTAFIPVAKVMVKVVRQITEVIHNNIDSILNLGSTIKAELLKAAKFWVTQYSNMMVVMENWDVALTVFVENLKVKLTNAFNFWSTVFKNMLTNAKNFWTNILEYPKWFVDNLKSILDNAFNYWKTVFSNMGENIKMVFSNIKQLITGEIDFENLWKPLTDGFKKAVLTELPKFKYDPKNLTDGFEPKVVSRKVSEMWDNVGKMQQKRSSELLKSLGLVEEVEKVADEIEKSAQKTPVGGGTKAASTGASEGKSKASIIAIGDISKNIQTAISGRKNDQSKLLEKQIKNQERQISISEQQLARTEERAILN